MTETLIKKLNWMAEILLMESPSSQLVGVAGHTALVIPA
jgi:hypothetical protein